MRSKSAIVVISVTNSPCPGAHHRRPARFRPLCCDGRTQASQHDESRRRSRPPPRKARIVALERRACVEEQSARFPFQARLTRACDILSPRMTLGSLLSLDASPPRNKSEACCCPEKPCNQGEGRPRHNRNKPVNRTFLSQKNHNKQADTERRRVSQLPPWVSSIAILSSWARERQKVFLI